MHWNMKLKTTRSALWIFAGLMFLLASLADTMSKQSDSAFLACGLIFLWLGIRARRREQKAAQEALTRKPAN